jgi:fibronectin-binding autotransporter adhesin
MIRSSHAMSLRACLVAATIAASASPVFAANYTWKTLSGTGNWSDSTNWSGTSATNLYPGSIGSGTADGAFIQAVYTSAPTINLDTSVIIRQLNVGGTTGATTFPVTLSTANASTLTLSTAASGTAILAVNSAVSSGTNLITPDILVSASTWETRMASVASGTVNLVIAGKVAAGSPGSHVVRYTPNNTSTTTAASLFELRGTIADGTNGGTLTIFYRNDMPNSQNTLKLSGTGNAFSGAISFQGGAAGTTLEASPASGTTGALGTGLLSLGASGSSATLNLGGSLSTVTEVNGITITGNGQRRIAVIGAGNRILSGTVNQANTSGLTLSCTSSGNLTLTNAISGAGPIRINSTGSGKVIFTATTSTFSGSTTVQAGGLQLGSGSPLGTTGTITPLAGGTLSLVPYAVTTMRLNPNAGGLVDVGNGSITVSSGLTVADMLTAITSGYNGGTWTGTTGITSSTAAANTAAGSVRAIGWLDNGSGSVTFAFAAPGDVNLDGLIDVLDAAALSSSGRFNDTAVWSEGDFNYDGIYDDLDNALFVSTGLFDAGPYNTPPGAAGAIAPVPEPAAGGLIAAVAGAILLGGRSARRRPPPG